MNEKVSSKSFLDMNVILELNEQQARALHDIVAYGYKPFMEVFKEKLGKHYIEKHGQGCKELFEIISQEMPKHFHKIDSARMAISGKYELKLKEQP